VQLTLTRARARALTLARTRTLPLTRTRTPTLPLTLTQVRKMVQKEPAVQAVLRSHRAALDSQFRRVAGEGTEQRPPVMSMASFVNELSARKVTMDVTVHPPPPVTGQPQRSYHSNLSWMDAKSAFVAAQKGAPAAEARPNPNPNPSPDPDPNPYPHPHPHPHLYPSPNPTRRAGKRSTCPSS
jgi:hypothetical protein